jgi:hypothetical protein
MPMSVSGTAIVRDGDAGTSAQTMGNEDCAWMGVAASDSTMTAAAAAAVTIRDISGAALRLRGNVVVGGVVVVVVRICACCV